MNDELACTHDHELRRILIVANYGLGFCLSVGLSLCLSGCTTRPELQPSDRMESSGPVNGPFFIRSQLECGVAKGLPPDALHAALKRWQIAIEGARNASRPVPILSRIDAPRTALLVIDMQRAFLDPGASIEVPAGRTVIPNINRLATAIRSKAGSVIFFRYVVDEDMGLLRSFEGQSYLGPERVSPMVALRRGHPQFELHPSLEVLASDLVMDKTRYSAVLGSDIVSVLRGKGIENVIVTGVTTDVCAGNTAEDLMQMDFHVVMVWDGTAALARLEHELYLARIFGLYGDVMPTEEVIQRLK